MIIIFTGYTLVENNKYFYSPQLTHKTVLLIIRLKYAICLFTKHGIVLSQAEQFDILELVQNTYSRRTTDHPILGQLMEK